MLKRILRIVKIVVIGVPVVMTLGLMIWARTVQAPTTLGLTNNQFAPCPASPNCVATQSALPEQLMAPLPYSGSVAEAKAQLRTVVEAMPRVTLRAEQDNYLAFVFRSQLISYPDDVEFYFDDAAKLLHFRSASRLGEGDMGVNRARMEAISQAFAAQE